MTVKQISIFLENKPGQLAGICRALAQAEINIAITQLNALRAHNLSPAVRHRQAPFATSDKLLVPRHNLGIDKKLKGLALLVETLYGNQAAQYAHLRCGNAYTLVPGILHRQEHTAAQSGKLLLAHHLGREGLRRLAQQSGVLLVGDAQNPHHIALAAADNLTLGGGKTLCATYNQCHQ